MNTFLQALLDEIRDQYQGQIPDISFDMVGMAEEDGCISITFPRTLSTPDIPGIKGYRGTEIRIWIDDDGRYLTVDVQEFNVYRETAMHEVLDVGSKDVFNRKIELTRPGSMEEVMKAVEEGLLGSAEVRQLQTGWWLQDD